jgi:GSH-dependent disulfide-bond oxidoreductase
VNISHGDQFKPEFLAISPNNRIPAIVDQEPKDGGKPIAVFESGAILLYLAEKTGNFMRADLRRKVEVIQWLFWQMGGLGPMAGQNHHFSQYALAKIPYAINRYVKETSRLYGVLNNRVFIAGEYSIADMATYPWIVPHERQGQKLDFTNSCERLLALRCVRRSLALPAGEIPASARGMSRPTGNRALGSWR